MMHIFVDETGSFSGIGKFPSISLVGALIVPDSRLASLEKKYAKLRKSFPKDEKGEVKGRLLNEQEIATVVPLLSEHSALFEAASIDLGLHTEQGLIAFQAQTAERMTGGLTDRHSESLKAQVWDYRRRFEAFKLPLMVQTIVTFEFFPRLIEFGKMYFSTTDTANARVYEYTPPRSHRRALRVRGHHTDDPDVATTRRPA
jgi:hypothetical protein